MRNLYSYIPAFLLSLFLMGSMMCADCQTVIMPAHGSGDTTMSYAEVYDDGGPNAPYSSSCNASYTFHTVSPNGRYRIEIESMLSHPQGNASLTIRNNNASGSLISLSPPDAFPTVLQPNEMYQAHIFLRNNNPVIHVIVPAGTNTIRCLC